MKHGRIDHVEGFRQVWSPLTKSMLAPIPGRFNRLQFDEALKDGEYHRIARLLDRHPAITMRVYGDYKQSINDLEFLRYFPKLRRFWVDLWRIDTFDGLLYLPANLQHLHLGPTKTKAISLQFLEKFAGLSLLTVAGHSKDFSAVSTLNRLGQLRMAGIPLSNLSHLTSLNRLQSLGITSG